LASVFFYISGHGFGHASRQLEIINTLGELRPDLSLVLRTSAPTWWLERVSRVPVTLIPGECDTGVIQIDSLRLDERQTVQRAAEFHRSLSERAQREAALLRKHDARFVVADAPPLGCAAANAADVPSVVITNFTWDWIYEGYAEQLRDAPDLLPAIRKAYELSNVAWRLPMHGGFATFDTIVDVPFVARHARHAKADVRRTLGLPPNRPLVLSSFGGYGVSGLDVRRLDCLRLYGVVVTCRDESEWLENAPAGIYQVIEANLYGAGLRYEELVSACDVVATKPGYGILAECIANGSAVLYTARGNFAEYDVLVNEMPRYLKCGFIDHERLFAGRWREALDGIMAAATPPEKPATHGASVIADRISERVGR
jgi:L-arabinokinase